MKLRRSLLIALLLLGVIAAGAWLARTQISLAIAARVVRVHLGVDLATQLPDGLHVGVCGAGSPFPDDLRDEARWAAEARARRGGSPVAADMLAMATIGSARVVGLGREIGSLVPGKRADIVAVQPAEDAPVDADPALAVLDPRARVVASWVDGRQVLGPDGPVLADTGSVNAAAREARARIM